MNTTYGVLNNSSLIVDTDKLRENVRTILRSLPAGTKLIPVVKDDAYGMGMVGVARTLRAFPEIGCFAVAHVSRSNWRPVCTASAWSRARSSPR